MSDDFIKAEDFMKALDAVYEKAIEGIDPIAPPIYTVADDFRKKYPDVRKAVKAMQEDQVAKCTVSGVITGFAGVFALPLSLPANLSSVLYVQLRMIACTALMGGYDLDSEEVRTFIYACLAGVSVNGLLKSLGLKEGGKMAVKFIINIPARFLAKINRRLGFLFVTKFGTRGIINLWQLIPGVGAAVNGGLDYTESKMLADRAYRMFIDNDFSVGETVTC